MQSFKPSKLSLNLKSDSVSKLTGLTDWAYWLDRSTGFIRSPLPCQFWLSTIFAISDQSEDHVWNLEVASRLHTSQECQNHLIPGIISSCVDMRMQHGKGKLYATIRSYYLDTRMHHGREKLYTTTRWAYSIYL
jgi:hypothetical protein